MKKVLILVLLAVSLFGCGSTESEKVDTSMIEVIGDKPKNPYKYEEDIDQIVAKIALTQKNPSVDKQYMFSTIYYNTKYQNDVKYNLRFDANKSDDFQSLTSYISLSDANVKDDLPTLFKDLPKLINGLEEVLPILKLTDSEIKDIISMIDVKNMDFNVQAKMNNYEDIKAIFTSYTVFEKEIDNLKIEFEVSIMEFIESNTTSISFKVRINQN